MDWLDLLAVQGTLKSLLQRFTHGGVYMSMDRFNWSHSSSPAVSTGDLYICANIVLTDMYGIEKMLLMNIFSEQEYRRRGSF